MGPQSVDEVAHGVCQFYEACSFPGYEEVETPFDLAEKAGRGIDHALAEAGWILTQGREGGFFILTGRRT